MFLYVRHYIAEADSKSEQQVDSNSGTEDTPTTSKEMMLCNPMLMHGITQG